MRKALERHQPGDEVAVRFIRRGRERSAQVRFIADPTLEVVRFEDSGGAPSEAQLAFRLAWLGADTGEKARD